MMDSWMAQIQAAQEQAMRTAKAQANAQGQGVQVDWMPKQQANVKEKAAETDWMPKSMAGLRVDKKVEDRKLPNDTNDSMGMVPRGQKSTEEKAATATKLPNDTNDSMGMVPGGQKSKEEKAAEKKAQANAKAQAWGQGMAITNSMNNGAIDRRAIDRGVASVAGMGAPTQTSVVRAPIQGMAPRGPAPPVDVNPIINVLAKINTTLKNSLTSIEGTAKKNDVKPSLDEVNDYLLQITASLPSQAGGGKTKSKKGSKQKSPDKSAKSAKSAAKPAKAKVDQEEDNIQLSSDPNINKVVESLSIINNTLSSTLAAIDSRLKNNNINPTLETMNQYLYEISESMPEQGGGGTRRSRVKNKTLRKRRA